MFAKSAAIFVLCLLPSNKIVEAATWEDAQEALNTVRNNVNQGLSAALSGGYAELSATGESTIQTTLSNGITIINETSNVYLTQFEEAKKAAEDAGTDITECLNTYEDQIKLVGPDNIEGLQQCVTAEIDSIVSYVYNTGTNLVQTYLNIFFNTCENPTLKCGPFDSSCLDNMIRTMARAGGSIISQIQNTIQQATGQFQPYLIRVTTCGDKFVSINEGKGKSLLDGFQQCIQEQSL